MRHLFLGLILLAAPAFAQEAVQPEDTLVITEKSVVAAERFMIAAAHPMAAAAGRDVLARGGSAIDAMVAAQFMLNLVEPQSSGIGGGAFLLYWDAAAGTLTTFDARETAPAAATPAYWLGADGEPVAWWDAVVGGRSVGVPGTLKLLDETHARFGRLDWADLIAPTLAAAEAGFEISPRLAASIAGAAERGLTRFPDTAAYFFQPDGAPRAAGTVLRNPAFAETLRAIAAARAQPLYEGALADAIIAAVRTETNPGILTRADLSAYRVITRAPVCIAYRGDEVCGMGPPSSGGLTVGQIMGVLEHFDMAGAGPGAAGLHLLAEASKLAFADRNLYMADADFVRMPTRGLLDAGYLTTRAQAIDPLAAMASARAGNPPWRDARLRAADGERERPGTSHLTVVDAAGNVVSLTTTIETGFGSRVMVGGFLLNNELTDFSRAPERDGRLIANRVEGGKRPRSSMAPTIVLRDGQPILALGSPGGSRIIGYVAQTLVGILDWGLDPAAAIAAPRVVNRNGVTDVEAGAVALAADLAALGHETRLRDLNSGLHVIAIDDRLIGGADPRREGVVLGE